MDSVPADRTSSDFEKLQQAMNFITSLRYENRCLLSFTDSPPSEIESLLSADIDWLCDMAFYVLSLLPSVGEKLSCFLAEDCENLADQHSVWCKHENLKAIIDGDDIQRSKYTPKSVYLN